MSERTPDQAVAIIEPLSPAPGRSSEVASLQGPLLPPPVPSAPFLHSEPHGQKPPLQSGLSCLWGTTAALSSLPAVERMLGQRLPSPPQPTTLDGAASLSLRGTGGWEHRRALPIFLLGSPVGRAARLQRVAVEKWDFLSTPGALRGQPPFYASALWAPL